MKKHKIVGILIFTMFCFCGAIFAQDLQNRTVSKFTADLNKDWYGVVWGIGNARLETPNNINVFGGIGYKRKSWWLESMVWKQWSPSGNNLALDLRFQKQFSNRSTLYVEQAPFLNKLSYYHFGIFEYPVWHKFNVGVETENVLKRGKDSIGGGPRVSRQIATIGKTKISAALSYRFRRQELNELRLYLVFNIPLKFRK